MYRTVLVPVDGSGASRIALRHAIAIANGSGATVHALAVVEPSRSSLVFGADDADDIDEAITALADAIADDVRAPNVTIQCDVRRGQPPYEVILEYADTIDADLIVLGRRGRTTLPEAIFGSTADRIARLTDVPVVIVPGPDPDSGGDDDDETT